jgi:hypothetical protein
MVFPSHVGVELNGELGEHGTPHPTSIGGRVRAYISSHTALFIVSTIMGVLTFFAIVSDPMYSSLGVALANGFGAFLFFGSRGKFL